MPNGGKGKEEQLAQDEEEETQAIGWRHVIHTSGMPRSLLGTGGGGATQLATEESPT